MLLLEKSFFPLVVKNLDDSKKPSVGSFNFDSFFLVIQVLKVFFFEFLNDVVRIFCVYYC